MTQSYFIASGCADLQSVPHRVMKREGDQLMVGCENSKQSWHLSCINNQWIGVIGNCSTGEIFILLDPSSLTFNIPLNLWCFVLPLIWELGQYPYLSNLISFSPLSFLDFPKVAKVQHLDQSMQISSGGCYAIVLRGFGERRKFSLALWMNFKKLKFQAVIYHSA